jgi:hypothetical protein
MAFDPECSTFRANPDYKLMLSDRLDPLARNRVLAAGAADEVYGALVPHGGSPSRCLAVSFDTALLFATLVEPGLLPRYVLRRLGVDVGQTIKRLLFDGVLQVLADGMFVSGPQAAESLVTRRASEERACSSDLTLSALQYGQALTGLSDVELGSRLYLYGRQPISPQLQRRLTDSPAVASFLGIEGGGRLAQSLAHDWASAPGGRGARDYWWQWTSRVDPPRGDSQRASYKLYVSPVVDDIPESLDVIVGALPCARGVTGFKVAVGLAGICRPDKIVMYFTQLDDLFSFSELLRSQLTGCGVHGVPFTAAASEDGLLSWGADPPRGAAGRDGASSWRMWVTWRLAEYLIAGQVGRTGAMEPWEYALERLKLAGIDTETWIPTNGMWPVALEAA